MVLKAKRIPAHNHPVIERLLTYRNVSPYLDSNTCCQWDSDCALFAVNSFISDNLLKCASVNTTTV